MKTPSARALRALNSYNYRLWVGGSLVSNVGTWMQRIAQDWLVLTQLTHRNAAAVGVVMALQSAPVLVLLPLTGYTADHFDRRKILIATQAVLGSLALSLGLLSITGLVRLWHVYVFAGLFGVVSAFDTPVRQAFGPELVPEADLANAVSLNSTSFNVARLVGPALAGILISAVGSGWAFLVNAASFVATLCALALLRISDIRARPVRSRARGALLEGFRYVWGRPDLRTVTLMIFVVATFGLNFPIFISTMAVSVFHLGAGQYGGLTSMMAVGSIAGAVLTARRRSPDVAFLSLTAAAFALSFALAGLTPNRWLFGLALVPIGVAAVAFSTSTGSYMQLASDPVMRGRVIALRLAAALGGAPIGAPLFGWVANTLGPRWAAGVGAASGLLAAITGIYWLRRSDASRASSDKGGATET